MFVSDSKERRGHSFAPFNRLRNTPACRSGCEKASCLWVTPGWGQDGLADLRTGRKARTRGTEATGSRVSVCAFVVSFGALFICVGASAPLVFLADENHVQANAKFTLCPTCPRLWIASEQICAFKTSYSRTQCTFSICISSCSATYASIQFANRGCVARRTFLSLYLKIRM